MRFLILTQFFDPEVGATQVRLSAFCKELVRLGHHVEVVTAMPNHPTGRIFPHYRNRWYSTELIGGVTVRRTWVYAGNKSGLHRILNYLSFMLTCFCGLFMARRPDYLFVDSPPIFLGIPGRLAAWWWRRPFVFNVADLWPDSIRDLGVMKEGPFLWLAAALEKWIYRRATYVTAVTEGIRNTLLTRKRVRASKVLFLPNGVDTELFAPTPPDERWKHRLGLSGKRVAIYAGNHGFAAGAEVILDAARILQDDPTLHFVFVGDGPEKPKLQQMVQNLALSNVSFYNSVPLQRLPRWISIADIALVTLRKSGVTDGARPAKAFVMMACGKPIVLAAEGEAQRLVEEAESGIVTPPGDGESFARAIRALLTDPALARRLGDSGRSFVCSRFQWSELVKDWLNQLQRAGESSDTREPFYGSADKRLPAKS